MTRLIISKVKSIVITLVVVVLFVSGLYAYAATVPRFVNYQGFLTNSSGTAQTGSANVVVRIYDAPTAGNLVYEEQEGSVTVSNGYFTIPIGKIGDVNGGTTAVSFTDLPFDKSYYVTIEFGAPFSTGEMTLAGGVRSEIGASPYAITSYGVLTSTTSAGLISGKGKMYFDTTTNQLYVYNGTSWNALGIAGAGITSFNGLSGVSQFFTIDQNGSDALITSTGTTHTLSLPNAGANSRGLVSTTTQTFAGDKTFSGVTTLSTTTVSQITASNISATTVASTNLVSTNATVTSLVSNNLTSTSLSSVSASISGALSALSATFSSLSVGGTINASSSAVTNATSTNFFATSGAFSSLIATLANITNLIVGNSTTTNAVATNLTATNATNTNLFSTNGIISNSTTTNNFATNLAATNGTIVNSVATNSTTTNGFISSLVATLANIANLIVGNSTTTNAFATNSVAASLTATSATSTNLFSTSATFTNSTAATAFVSNLSSNSLLSTLLTVSSTSTLATTTASSFTTGVFYGASLANCNASTDKLMWANGSFYCGTDAGGAGGTISTLNGSAVVSQSFATSSSNGLELTIVTNTGSGVHTFTPSLAFGYSIPFTSSTTEWSTFYTTPSTRIALGSNLSWSGNTINFSATPSFTSLSTIGNTSVGGTLAVTGTTTLATTTVSSLTLSNDILDGANGSRLITASTSLGNYFFGSAGNLTTIGLDNVAVGLFSSMSSVDGVQNVSVGNLSLSYNTSGNNNTAIGYLAGRLTNTASANATSSDSIYLGYDTRSLSSGVSNEIVIGASARGQGSNSVTLGNSSITKTQLRGNVILGTTASSTALTANTLYSTVANLTNASTTNFTLLGSFFDSVSSKGTLGQVLLSTGTSTQWVATSSLGISGGAGVTGGTFGYVTRWLTPTTLGTSTLIDDGSVLGINATSSTVTFNLQGIAGKDAFNVSSSTGSSLLSVKQDGSVEVPGQIVSKGVTWTSRTSAADNTWSSVAYGNGMFVAVSTTGSGNRVMTSPDGINWTIRTTPVNNQWISVTYGNGMFVAVSWTGSGNRVMTSPDGITWTSRTSAANNQWFSVTYGKGIFVAVAATGAGNRVMTSPDGITWTLRTSAADNNWDSVTYGNGLFVAVAYSGTGNRVMTSPDGITWTLRTSAADNQWNSVTYGNGLFVAVGCGTLCSGSSSNVMTSPDGITWTGRTGAADNQWNSVTYGNGLFVAVSDYNNGTISDRVMTSPDGITWSARTASANNAWQSITYGNGLFVSVAWSGTGNRVMTSGTGDMLAVSNNNIYQGGMSVYGAFNIGTTTATNIVTFASSTGSALFSFDQLGRMVFGSTTNANIFVNGGATNTPVADSNSIALGNGALTYISTSSVSLRNIALGYQALFGSSTARMTGTNNFAVGDVAGFNNTTGSGNNFIGLNAGYSNTTGSTNNFFGQLAGVFNTTGSDNNFFGSSAGQANTSGNSNNFIGFAAGSNNLVGSNNNFIGTQSGTFNTAGSNNNFLGYRSGRNSTGSGNLFFGYQAASSTTAGDYNLALGYDVSLASSTGSNQLNIGNLIYGQGINSTSSSIIASSNISIGTSSSINNSKFSIQGSGSLNPFSVASSSGQVLFSVLSNGGIGIGTTTSGSSLDVYKNTSATSTDIFRLISDVGATGDVKFRITANGDIFTDGATTIGSPADLAEMYPSDEVLPAGTVVALGQATTTWSLETGDSNDEFSMSVVRRASGADTVFGVVSTKPGLVLGGTTIKGVPIALSGRVPVLVTNDNGVIRRGDYLVLATGTPGYAMKQTEEGEVIGRAVSDMQEGVATGTVLVAVSYERRPGSIATLTGLTEYVDQETFATSTSASNQASVFEVLSEKVSRGVTIVREYVAVSVKAVSGYFDKLFAKEIYTDKVCIKKSNGTNVCFTGDEVESLINSNNMPLLNSSNQVTTDPSSSDTGGQATSTNEGTVDNQTNIPAIEEASSTPVQDVSGTEPQNTSSVSE